MLWAEISTLHSPLEILCAYMSDLCYTEALLFESIALGSSYLVGDLYPEKKRARG